MTTPWHNAPWTPRAWQAEALPAIVDAMKRGERGLVSAIMGSGKSVLMAELVWLAMHKRGDRAIVVTAPRQFLVRQLAATIADRVGSLEVGLYYAEKKQPQRSVIVTCAASLSSLRVELESQGRRVALLIADEAHGTEAVMAKTEIPALAPVCLVGFTATPYRSIPSESVSLFSTVIYRYTMKDALRDRVLVPMRHVRYEGNDPGTVDEECLRLIRQYGNGPGIVSASSILDADEYAHWLTERWEPTSAIHSRIKTNTRAAMLCGLQSGAKSALVHVSLLAEGVDLPWLQTTSMPSIRSTWRAMSCPVSISSSSRCSPRRHWEAPRPPCAAETTVVDTPSGQMSRPALWPTWSHHKARRASLRPALCSTPRAP